MKPRIAILYICTGRYYVFWKQFYKSAEKNLLTDCEKHYFVFTDYERQLYGEKCGSITRIYQEKLGWPNDTLMRFEIFLKAENELKKYDYIYFFNANITILSPVDHEIIPEKEGLVGVLHPFYYNQPRITFTYDTNPLSTAYISEDEGNYYFMGGLNGGNSEKYLELIRELDKNIKIDLSNGIVAKWHDESHLNRYFIDHPAKVISDEKWCSREHIPGKKFLVIDKANPKYGGHDWLRGVTEKKVSYFRFYYGNISNKLKSLLKK